MLNISISCSQCGRQLNAFNGTFYSMQLPAMMLRKGRRVIDIGGMDRAYMKWKMPQRNVLSYSKPLHSHNVCSGFVAFGNRLIVQVAVKEKHSTAKILVLHKKLSCRYIAAYFSLVGTLNFMFSTWPFIILFGCTRSCTVCFRFWKTERTTTAGTTTQN